MAIFEKKIRSIANTIKDEFIQRKGDYKYEAFINPGPPPLDFED